MTQKKTERAFELLGSVMSTITGVPSARDHRRVLEQILAVRQQQEGLLGLMKQQNVQDAKIVKRFHSYEIDLADSASTSLTCRP